MLNKPLLLRRLCISTFSALQQSAVWWMNNSAKWKYCRLSMSFCIMNKWQNTTVKLLKDTLFFVFWLDHLTLAELCCENLKSHRGMIDCRRIGLFISPPHSVFFIFCGHWLRVKASRIKIFKLFICPHYMISAECTSSLNACLIVDFFDKQQKSSLVVLSAPPRLTESLPLTREEVSRRNCVFVCKTYKNILVITHNTHTLIQKSYSHSSER